MFLATLFFFTACEEEFNNVGKDNAGNQFNLLFKEFTLPSHVIINSVKTSEVGLLTGKYIDAEFGTVTSEAYSAFGGVLSVDLTGSNIVFDSLVFHLKLMPYYYGTKTTSPITFKIHELKEEITSLSKRTNFSQIAYDPIPLGEGSYTLNPEKHDILEKDTLLAIKLNNMYFQKVQDKLTSTTEDNTTSSISSDAGFYGFAILASDADKVIRISTTSHVSIHYHTVEGNTNKDSFRYDYSLTSQRYNKITSDRSGTPIAALKDSELNTSFETGNKLRYVQSGTGVSTEIDFEPFINFFNKKKELQHVVFNSVELSHGAIESTSDFAPPTGILLLNTNENSELSPLQVFNTQVAKVLPAALSNQLIRFSEQEDSGIYSTVASTRYFQFVYDHQVERLTALILPSVAVHNNTVVVETGYKTNRFILHADSIKLKVYYTLPK